MTRSPIPHTKDCPDCFGFGFVVEDHGQPQPEPTTAGRRLTSAEAHEWDGSAGMISVSCATCGGYWNGVRM